MSKPTDHASPFLHTRRIIWGDTDGAGIVYTPRVGHFAMEAVEAWFLDRLTIDWLQINAVQRIGTPFVRLEIDFKSRMSPPDMISTRVILEKAGRSSLNFRITCRIADTGRLCWEALMICVFVSNETYRSIPVPPHYVDAVQREAELGARILALE